MFEIDLIVDLPVLMQFAESDEISSVLRKSKDVWVLGKERTVVEILFKESIFFSRVPDKRTDLTVLRVAHERWGPKTDAQRRNSGRFSLVIVLGGQGQFGDGQKSWPLHAGAVFCFGPGGPFSFRVEPKRSLEIIITDFDGRKAQRLVENACRHTRTTTYPNNPDLVCANAQHLFSVAWSKQPFAIDICAHLLQALLLNIRAGLTMKAQNVSPAQESFYNCKRYLDRHFQNLASPGEAAEHADLSQAYMCRLFRRFADTSPQAYLTRLKMNLAAHLLSTSDLSVKQIGMQLGFADQYAFSKCFKRLLGTAPAHYRIWAS